MDKGRVQVSTRLFLSAFAAWIVILAGAAAGCGGGRSDVARLSPDQTVGDLSAYWTPERTAAATALPQWGLGEPAFEPSAEAQTSSAEPLEIPPMPPSSPYRSSANPLPDVAKCTAIPDSTLEACWSRFLWKGQSARLPARTVGRILYEIGSRTGSCTATVVSSENGSVVWTAAHCLLLDGDEARNIVFVPGYRDGEGPFGKWQPRDEDSIYMLQSWVDTYSSAGFTDEAVRHDIAALVLEERDGKTIAESVGSQGIRFEEALADELLVFGYPQRPPFDGSTLYACRSPVTDRASSELGTGVVGLGCDMPGGASGGPMIADSFDDVTGWGWLMSNVSGGPTPDLTYGPRLGQEARELWEKAQSAR